MRNPLWPVVSLVLLALALALPALPRVARAARPHATAKPVRILTIPKYVEELPQLPTLDGTTTSRSSPAVLSLREFQQQILPASVYRQLTGRYRKGARTGRRGRSPHSTGR